MKIITQNINYNSGYVSQNETYRLSYYDAKFNLPISKSNASLVNFKSLLKNISKPQILNQESAISKIKNYLGDCKDLIKVEEYLDTFKIKDGYDLGKIKKLSFLKKVGNDQSLVSLLFYAVVSHITSFGENIKAVKLLMNSNKSLTEIINILSSTCNDSEEKIASNIIEITIKDDKNLTNKKAPDKILELEKTLPKLFKYLELYNFAREKKVKSSFDEYNLAHLINYCYKNAEFCPEIFNYIKNNLNKENLLLDIKYGRTEDEQNIYPEKLAIAQTLYERPISKKSLAEIMNSNFWNNENLLKDFDKVQEYFPKIGTKILLTCYEKKYSIEELENIRNSLFEIAKNSEMFEDGLEINTNISDFLENEIFISIEAIFDTIKILGKDNFLKLAKEKFDELDTIINLTFFPLKVDWQPLIDMLHPENTSKFKEIEQEILVQKKNFKLNEDNTQIINKIKELSAKKNNILDKKLTDPKEIFEKALLYKILSISNEECLKEILPFIASKKESDREEFKKILNAYAFNFLNIEIKNETVKNVFDFSRSKYIDRLPIAEVDFKDGINALVKVVEENFSSNISETLNNLPHNITTKKEFENLNLSYDKWVSPLENITLKCNTIPNIHKKLHNTLDNLQKEFNTSGFYNIPQQEKQALEEAMQKNGFSFQASQNSVYDEDGNYSGEVCILKILKNFLPLNIETAKEFIEFFNDYTKNSPFWNTKNKNKTIEQARVMLLDHILKRRFCEIEKISKGLEIRNFKELIIQKVDMDDIVKSLFLGDDAGCCTASDGCNSWSAAAYILNKCMQAIEFNCRGNSYGNTMCFLAKVNGKLALILDNIEVKSEFQYSNELRDAIIDFSKKLCTEIGKPDMSIYAGANRHYVDFNDFPIIEECTIEPIGVTDDYIYVDAFDGGNKFEINNPLYCSLIKIKD